MKRIIVDGLAPLPLAATTPSSAEVGLSLL